MFGPRTIRLPRTLPFFGSRLAPVRIQPAHRFSLNPKYMGAVKGWGTIANIAAGAYIGGLLVCAGSLYFIYKDAESRQHIPFELRFEDQYTAVKAICKDNVLQSPRYAVKHYRRLLIELARQCDPDLQFSETLPDGLRNYAVPLLSADDLIYEKSPDFANFYIDMCLRYARALLAKGQLDVSISVLKYIVDDDDIFYKLGDAERMSQCCRVLSKVSLEDKVKYLERNVDMLATTFLQVHLDSDFLLLDDSRITDELILSLNDLAFAYARDSASARGKSKKQLLLRALNIYLANLKHLTQMKDAIESEECSQASFPLFDCEPDNLKITSAEIKAHISEVLWALGYKKNAVAWGEEVVEEIYFDHGHLSRASPILIDVLGNLTEMYTQLRDAASVQRCKNLKSDLRVFEGEPLSWYDSVVNRFAKIIFYRGPLGILEKAIKERFGRPERIPDIEEYEDEDEEI